MKMTGWELHHLKNAKLCTHDLINEVKLPEATKTILTGMKMRIHMFKLKNQRKPVYNLSIEYTSHILPSEFYWMN